MASLNTRSQTHQWMLPQFAALESAPAENAHGVSTERGSDVADYLVAPGVQQGRGEIGQSAPAVRRHPKAGSPVAGDRGGNAPVVFVLDKHGTPVQPTSPARARQLLDSGRAVVARHTPFVIRLKDRTIAESTVQGVRVGIDPGSKHTGIAVFTCDGAARTGKYSIRLDHRGGQIRDRLASRANYRRRRRSANLRYRAPRFANRAKPKGWLAPSLRHRVDTTMSWVSRLTRWAPVRVIHFERVSFDTHALSAGRPLDGVEYQQGTLAGYEVRQYLLEKWGRACVYCGRENLPLQVEHLHPRVRGGSDRISNLTLACRRCNQAKNAAPVEEFLQDRPALLAQVVKRAKLPLRDAAAVNATRWVLWRALEATGLPVVTGSGGRTGDLVRANLPNGKNAGVHTGRVAVRSTGRFNITTAHGTVQGINHGHVRLLQRADGYGYTTTEESTVETSSSGHAQASEGLPTPAAAAA